jgi:dTDP-glucose pyrophosphorylase
MDIKKYFVNENISVRDAIKAIEATGKKVVFVVDKEERLLGIFTDGDMRRFIMKNGELSAPVREAMNEHPVVFREDEEDKLQERVAKDKMLVYPMINSEGHLVRAIFWDDVDMISSEDNLPQGMPIVIMAGGIGSRLYPYTKILPKPLIPIGELPISEHIIERFRRYGCDEFFMVINYKKNMIKAYFNDLEKDYKVHYMEEQEFLGTGGGLKLLESKIDSAFFLTNCDILVEASYSSIYRYHKNSKNKITVVCAMKNIKVPYGVINLDGNGKIDSMTEKPEYSFLTNTGLYVIEPEVIGRIKVNTFTDMPSIIQSCIDDGENVGVYPITEKQWLDMGQMADLNNMVKALEKTE